MATRRQFAEGFGPAEVTIVESQPINAEPVADGTVIKLQGDLPLGPISQSVGNRGFLIAVTVGIPAFWEVQLAVKEAVKILAARSSNGW